MSLLVFKLVFAAPTIFSSTSKFLFKILFTASAVLTSNLSLKNSSTPAPANGPSTAPILKLNFSLVS